jgi:hypothetical protein
MFSFVSIISFIWKFGNSNINILSKHTVIKLILCIIFYFLPMNFIPFISEKNSIFDIIFFNLSSNIDTQLKGNF